MPILPGRQNKKGCRVLGRVIFLFFWGVWRWLTVLVVLDLRSLGDCRTENEMALVLVLFWALSPQGACHLINSA